ncbi:unnamed protein product [Owenia fusiformis]|uniref:Uncharacterized protein n=1 Tax=Owenia fusiformis TaxID=6347 RepID=A0A8J1TXZ1_OWEFU|nr:unnamed protein product [Owenia fusiformis]
MAGRRLFYIKSVLNPENVMDVKHGSKDAGTRIVMYNQKKYNNDNQLFYEENGTIRSLLTGFCLDIDGEGKLCVNPDNGGPMQGWLLVDQTVQNTDQTNLCLDIEGNNPDEWAEVVAYDYNGGQNQKWEFDTWAPAGGLFFIKSELNGLVMDVSGSSTSSGTEVVTWEQKTDQGDKEDWANQLFWEDVESQTIRSALTGYCLDMSAEDRLEVRHYDPNNPLQKWTIAGSTILNPDTGKVLDIDGADTEPDAKIIMFDYGNATNQHWQIEYAQL